MKKMLAILLALTMLLSVCGAAAEEEFREDAAAITVNGEVITAGQLKAEIKLAMFRAALQCAGYGYGYDITDRANIENSVDTDGFDLKMYAVVRKLAAYYGVDQLTPESEAVVDQRLRDIWDYYIAVAHSDNGMAFLPAGDYEYVDGDPEGNVIRYFASFGLTQETLRRKLELQQMDEQLKAMATAGKKFKDDDEVIDYFTDWFLERYNEAVIVEDEEVISQVVDALASEFSAADEGDYGGEDDDFEAYERSVLIIDTYYEVGASTVRDFEARGWTWEQAFDGTFALKAPGTDCYVDARSEDGSPDSPLVMINLMYAEDIYTEYMGYGEGPGIEGDNGLWDYLESVYGGVENEEGTLQARTAQSSGRTLLIETKDQTVCLTLLDGDSAGKGTDAAVGSIVTFGHYEQDANPGNGPEPIEWVVLDTVDGKALLMSRYILDSKSYNEPYEVVSWEACGLRAWLNGAFLSTAFTEEELAAILTTQVDNSAAQSSAQWQVRPCADTFDRIFLLSFREACELYFDSDEARMLAPTDYAAMVGATRSEEVNADGNLTCWWWLRSNYSETDGYAGMVDETGYVSYVGVSAWNTGVAPVCWVDLEAGVI